MRTKHMKVDAQGQIHESTFEEARQGAFDSAADVAEISREAGGQVYCSTLNFMGLMKSLLPTSRDTL